jgi:hypothetical protein
MINGEVRFRGEGQSFQRFKTAAEKIEEGLSREENVRALVKRASEIAKRRAAEKEEVKKMAKIPAKGKGV